MNVKGKSGKPWAEECAHRQGVERGTIGEIAVCQELVGIS